MAPRLPRNESVQDATGELHATAHDGRPNCGRTTDGYSHSPMASQLTHALTTANGRNCYRPLVYARRGYTMHATQQRPCRVLGVMGWSKIDMAQRYMHVPDQLRQQIASQLGGLLWTVPENDGDDGTAGALLPV